MVKKKKRNKLNIKNLSKEQKILILGIILFSFIMLGIYLNLDFVVFSITFLMSAIVFIIVFFSQLKNPKMAEKMFSPIFLGIYSSITLVTAFWFSFDGNFARMQEETRRSQQQIEKDRVYKKLWGSNQKELNTLIGR